MSLLDRRQLLAKTARRYLDVPLPDGSAQRIRSLTTTELRELEASLCNPDGSANRELARYAGEALICATAVDENNQLQFTSEDAFNGILREVDGQLTKTIIKAARRWTGFLDHVGDDDLEAAIKNSLTAPPNA